MLNEKYITCSDLMQADMIHVALHWESFTFQQLKGIDDLNLPTQQQNQSLSDVLFNVLCCSAHPNPHIHSLDSVNCLILLLFTLDKPVFWVECTCFETNHIGMLPMVQINGTHAPDPGTQTSSLLYYLYMPYTHLCARNKMTSSNIWQLAQNYVTFTPGKCHY